MTNTPVEAELKAFLQRDPFGRYFHTGFTVSRYANVRGNTTERSKVDTIYVHILMWKPLLHTLIHRTCWEDGHLVLYTNYELKRDALVLSFEEFCHQYNFRLQPFVERLEDEDLHPSARKVLETADLLKLHDFCINGFGRRFVRLNTTYRRDIEESLAAKIKPRTQLSEA